MANRAYASFWTRDYSEQSMLERFGLFLETLPLSSKDSGFLSLTVRAVSPAETPVAEHDLSGTGAKPADILALARECAGADCAYEVEASWPLWSWDTEKNQWVRSPERLLLVCQGGDYDEGIARATGQFLLDAGLEHLYTGHGGLLGYSGQRDPTADPIESKFLALMSDGDRLHEYQQKTRENIGQFLDWAERVQRVLPVERMTLWSEGEENLEARLDDILAAR
jgi:hypothetical protein